MQRLGVEPSRSVGREGYSLAGVRPRLTLRNGAQCRLSACDIRFVGPTLFTSELTGHGWRPLAVTIRSHQVDSLAATPVASVVKLAAGVGIEPTSYALTGRRIALMLTGKNKMERSAGIEPASSAWKAEAQSH